MSKSGLIRGGPPLKQLGPPPMKILFGDPHQDNDAILALSEWLRLSQPPGTRYTFIRAARLALLCFGIDWADRPHELEKVTMFLNPKRRAATLEKLGLPPTSEKSLVAITEDFLKDLAKRLKRQVEKADEESRILNEERERKLDEKRKRREKRAQKPRILGPDDSTDSGTSSGSDPELKRPIIPLVEWNPHKSPSPVSSESEGSTESDELLRFKPRSKSDEQKTAGTKRRRSSHDEEGANKRRAGARG